jgi:RES domain-containing protein
LTITAWRVVKQRIAGTAFDGEGAREFGGRWNSTGHAVVYTASTTSLALLEILVHSDAGLLAHYVAIPVTFKGELVDVVDADLLPAGWSTHPSPFELKRIGDEWIDSRRSCVLRVPSAVVTHEWNYLLNPAHPDFSSVDIGDPIAVETDARLR